MHVRDYRKKAADNGGGATAYLEMTERGYIKVCK